MSSLTFTEFRKYANSKLNILKEEMSSQYAEYVMKNFGKLQESVSIEDLYHIAKHNNIDKKDVNIVKNAEYNDTIYDYFVHDNSTCIGVNKDGRIVYIGDYYPNNLVDGSLMESSNLRIDAEIKALETEIKRLKKEAGNAPKAKFTGFSKYEDKMNHAKELEERVRKLKVMRG